MSSPAELLARHLAEAGDPDQPLASVSILTVRPGRSGARPDVFSPPTDVYETAEAIMVRMEIAGAIVSEIRIILDAEGRRLAVRGARRDPAAGASRRYHNMEIQCGDFGRDIALPAPVDPDAAAAKYEDGFLVIRLLKRAPAASAHRAIPIA